MEKMNFNLVSLLRENIRNLTPYSTARDEFQGVASVFLDANESPFNNEINRYPDPLQQELKVKVSRLKNVHPHQIFFGNGSDEAIDLVYRAFCKPGLDNVVAMKPTYGMYKVAADINGVEYREVLLNEYFMLDSKKMLQSTDAQTKAIFLCSPNNPTANNLVRDDVIHLLDNFNGIVVLDEAYADFSEQESFLTLLDHYPNLIVLQTFSKAWGMAGIRLGMAFASKEIIRVFNQIKYPYNINILTQRKALDMLKGVDRKNKNVKMVIAERTQLLLELNKLEIIQHVFPTDANFVLVRFENSKAVYNWLLEQQIIVRDRSKVALCEGCLRITVGTKTENKALIKALTCFVQNRK